MELTVPILVAVIFAVVVGDRLSLSVFDALARFKNLPYFMTMPGISSSGSLQLRSEHAQCARDLIVADSPVMFQHSTTADLKELVSKNFDSNYVPILENSGKMFCFIVWLSLHIRQQLGFRLQDRHRCLSEAADSRLRASQNLDECSERHRSPSQQSHQGRRRN
jgi:hypothetical protein